MSDFLHHEACDMCGSSDARAVFDDGHKYCFSCEEFTPPPGNGTLMEYHMSEKEREDKKNKSGDTFSLPPDYNYSIPQQGIDWLKKYGIDDFEKNYHLFGWSPSWYQAITKDPETGLNMGYMHIPMLVMPFNTDPYNRKVGSARPTGWQGRLFPPFGGSLKFERKLPKYFKRIEQGFIPHYEMEDSDSICIVEDVLSALKVVRTNMSSAALLGNSLSKSQMLAFSQRYKRLVIWLDEDMTEKAIQLQKDSELYFELGADVVQTSQDPKCYSDELILAQTVKLR